jgi:hypothetical protein
MKTKEPTFPTYDWPQSGRPQQPYRLDPVTLVERALVPIDEELVDATSQPYLAEPIHTEVRRLAPGAGETFVTFATRLGLHDFHDWAGPASGAAQWAAPGGFKQLLDLLARYDTGLRSFTREELDDAWTSLPEDAVRRQTQALRDAFSYAETHSEDLSVAARGVLGMGWEVDAFRIDLELDETGERPIVYERPQHIWSRAWFELIEGLRGERLPKTCAHCGFPFVPTRSNKKYCTTECSKKAYDKKRSRNPKRIAAQAAAYRRRKAQQRGTGDIPSSGDTEE